MAACITATTTPFPVLDPACEESYGPNLAWNPKKWSQITCNSVDRYYNLETLSNKEGNKSLELRFGHSGELFRGQKSAEIDYNSTIKEEGCVRYESSFRNSLGMRSPFKMKVIII
ncbi:hypothetical protein Y1Q_0002120 [Alligator mississippiensis]|uniref:Uncharacterized protein n=1 Tax=Alligator mississippiensis TaxID=8496 RepID=A0A151MPT4_ALLMI|nr:hypothetical protein Y1Q_0002120 [Alligator mississippiensis]